MTKRREILLDGYTAEEILCFSDADLQAFVFTDEPLAFRIGSAEILGQFRLDKNRLVVELAHIDGGGEGVLKTLWQLAARYATSRQLGPVGWIVHAVSCASPNFKLRRVMERLGFVVRDLPNHGLAYHYVQDLGAAHAKTTR